MSEIKKGDRVRCEYLPGTVLEGVIVYIYQTMPGLATLRLEGGEVNVQLAQCEVIDDRAKTDQV